MRKEKNQINDLEDRLIRFAFMNMVLAEKLNYSYVGNHLKNQLIRSSTSPVLNYAEAQFAESKNDFIHKIKVVLKELGETRVCIKLIGKFKIYEDTKELTGLLKESNELIAIFVSSINTARKSKLTTHHQT